MHMMSFLKISYIPFIFLIINKSREIAKCLLKLNKNLPTVTEQTMHCTVADKYENDQKE